jgi:hypothetical protein
LYGLQPRQTRTKLQHLCDLIASAGGTLHPNTTVNPSLMFLLGAKSESLVDKAAVIPEWPNVFDARRRGFADTNNDADPALYEWLPYCGHRIRLLYLFRGIPDLRTALENCPNLEVEQISIFTLLCALIVVDFQSLVCYTRMLDDYDNKRKKDEEESSLRLISSIFANRDKLTCVSIVGVYPSLLTNMEALSSLPNISSLLLTRVQMKASTLGLFSTRLLRLELVSCNIVESEFELTSL